MKPLRRSLLLGGAAMAVLGARAATGLLPAPRDLRAETEVAARQGRALVLLVSLDNCPFCKVARENYLVPLRAEGQPVVQVDMAHHDALAGFQGEATTHERLIRSLGVRVAPTVLFLGRGGRELAPRMAGLALPDFYGAYLQERVEAANRAAG